MGQELRLKGQEIQIRLTQGRQLLRTLTAIETLTWTIMSDILRKGYLGETTERKDDIYKGSKVEFGFDAESKEPFVMVAALRDRMQKRTAAANAQVNIMFTCNLADGTRPRILIPDLKFQDPSLAFANRESYAGFRFQCEAEDFQLSGV